MPKFNVVLVRYPFTPDRFEWEKERVKAELENDHEHLEAVESKIREYKRELIKRTVTPLLDSFPVKLDRQLQQLLSTRKGYTQEEYIDTVKQLCVDYGFKVVVLKGVEARDDSQAELLAKNTYAQVKYEVIDGRRWKKEDEIESYVFPEFEKVYDPLPPTMEREEIIRRSHQWINEAQERGEL